MKKISNEEWKELELPEEERPRLRYAVSNYGRIMSFSKSMEKGNVLGGGLLGGYPTLKFRVNDKTKNFFVHKLVAEYFLEKENENQKAVIHLDYNKKNNHVDNLKWADKDEVYAHQQHSPLVLASRKRRRENPQITSYKLTPTQVIRLKKMIFDPNRKTRLKIIAKQFGISEMQLYRIKSGENWGHIKVDMPEKQD